MSIIDTKLEELLLLAEVEKDLSTSVVLNVLLSARQAGIDDLLAKYLQLFAKDVMLPFINQSLERIEARKN